mmetsp:Transcript_14391/g.49150  ORF Transcript_14391/g.49150 Transcript_14391/m.49150 type:complete len:203 (-) Transcript_14391:75-683(-)
MIPRLTLLFTTSKKSLSPPRSAECGCTRSWSTERTTRLSSLVSKTVCSRRRSSAGSSTRVRSPSTRSSTPCQVACRISFEPGERNKSGKRWRERERGISKQWRGPRLRTKVFIFSVLMQQSEWIAGLASKTTTTVLAGSTLETSWAMRSNSLERVLEGIGFVQISCCSMIHNVRYLGGSLPVLQVVTRRIMNGHSRINFYSF